MDVVERSSTTKNKTQRLQLTTLRYFFVAMVDILPVCAAALGTLFVRLAGRRSGIVPA
jgi:hypothetical protein